MRRIIKETDIPFIKYSKTAIAISLVIIVIGLIFLIFRGLNFGIDFTGGTLIQVKFDQPRTVEDIRDALATINLENSIIQKSGENEFIIRVPQDTSSTNLVDVIKSTLGVSDQDILRQEQVGPKIGKELRRAALMAIFFSLIAMGIYIAIRFKFQYSIGVILSLLHDVLITLTVFTVFQLEVSLSTIAAFLTIIGFSLNDTIVVFDRVRENLKLRRNETYERIMDISINETLSRTIITNMTTFFAVLCLLLVPGEVRIFAIAMTVGSIAGTYSTIYIAGPVVVFWARRFKRSAK
ncbi:MAG TPA: protein translocase subunit SecF [Candidatus Marinimicrobia bacterium]|nr:protein translocase subunit SecF [Candidatus Neomarinimicrobiota bacterium]HRS51781.1 protein translocase subunit SecF [Candidatus Neomarinimicrobiota bacterium]HRU93051.1 protein translocase subunit SecF [Candidatus Neomarinimicrobiota bacterium]